MEVSYEIIPEILGFSLSLGIIYFFLYKRYLFSVIDPLFIFIFNTTFSSVLIIEVVEEPKFIFHFFLCQLFLYLGFAFVQEKTKTYAIIKKPQDEYRFYDVDLLELTVYCLAFLYILANSVLFYTKGSALLTDNPTEAKVANFQQGFGIFRKINWSVGGVLGIGLIYLNLTQQNKRYQLLLLILVFFTALEGSKSSLLKIVFSAALLFFHPYFQKKQAIIRPYFKYIPVAIVGLFTVFFIVLFKENDTPELALLAFLRRLLYGADSVLYFYNDINQDYFSQYRFWQYPAYILNPILGFFRIVPYNEAFGNVMVENSLPPDTILDVIVGPNTSFYIEGQIFFGYLGGILYSGLVGGAYAFLRWIYFSLKKSPAFLFVFFCYVCQLASILLIDVNLFVAQLFDTCFFVLPIYIGVCFIKHKKIVIRRPQFTLRRLVL